MEETLPAEPNINKLVSPKRRTELMAAQDEPRVEVFTGFTYTRVNSATDIPAFSAKGGGGNTSTK